MPGKRYTGVRLRPELGWVTAAGVLASPREAGASQSPSAAPDAGVVAFHVVETPRAVALLEQLGPLRWSMEEEAVALRLLEAGFLVVVWIGLRAPGAAVAHCYSTAEEALEEAAVGIWALKALGGGDASSLMTFRIMHVAEIERSDRADTVRIHQSTGVTVRTNSGSDALDVRRKRVGWEALRQELASDRSRRTLVVADVDWALAYNDAYGHDTGDLMLARLQALLEAAADREGAELIRVGGDDFALLLPTPDPTAATRLAEAVRQDVEALNLPFHHPQIKTLGRVTLSLAVLLPDPGAELRSQLEDAIYAAKRAGRNIIVNALTSD